MNQLELKEIDLSKEGENPDRFLSENGFAATLPQMPFYAGWQRVANRTVRSFIITKDGKAIIYYQAIIYSLLGKLNYIVVPYGPLVIPESITNEVLIFLKKEINYLSKKENAVFCRLDFFPSLDLTTTSKVFYKAPRFTYKGAYFQPRVEWALGLHPTEQEILAAMHQKTRYSINLAKRKNLHVELIETNLMDHFADFYKLSAETAKRDGFHLHPRAYYEKVFSDGEKDKNITLVKVSFEGEVLVANLILYYADKAMYIYGSSSNNHRNLMPAHLAQWEAIAHAKKRGATEYNFGGIHTEQFPNKAWQGITYFKRNFGGYEIVHSPFYDVVQKPFWYIIYCIRKLLKSV